LVERRSPKPEAEGSSPSAPANLSLEIMRNPIKFIQEVKQEAFKVTWPTWKETLQGALMVFVMAVVMSLFFLLLDQVLKFFLELLLKVSI
jgi:preprotein translocase subunit SecE